MKAIETVQKALGLLGYAENDGNSQLTQRVMNRTVTLVNLVYSDLSRICEKENEPIKTLNDELKLPENVFDVLECGVAGYIAQSENDDNAQYLWMGEYQQRRARLSRVTEYKDVLPVPE
ncbi:MAG: hypothetical protein J6D52_08080 [Clostridia bacterium]|nr:hypothetical protein [Clostridia bacterium]